jgi:uncharacterized protein (UPF0332 family)
MGIFNTLEKCLDSPYLFHDPEAPARVPALLALAEDRLETARANLGRPRADAGDAAMLIYEGMFACIRALVYARGYREAGLRCLLIACERLYVTTGQLDAALVHAVQHAQGLKLKPDEALARAGALLDRSRELVARPAPAQGV